MFYAQARRPAYAPQLRSVDHSLERFLANAFGPSARQSTAQAPQVKQDEQFVTFTIDVPGLSREQLAINLDGNVVRVESVQDAPRTIKLAYELAQEIDAEASQAKLENGVLTLKIARKAPVKTARSLVIS
ncbi:Hsp20/alpha crystallin family protein [Xylophilus sp. GOD-11R]|uniref:Hsp20/alpha crystallin family protein n=1 Tax=Xylophilus sp. GOD-11R TaxID=3089814 RepID=UPI00298BFBE4|nr:Hsp20/alpha crystallin family protein [Xylophilus sp. GOD-11R]WPB59069.1 Hsp20/alpha crystallin family protein [Xylophilus sp. GOD-11R]